MYILSGNCRAGGIRVISEDQVLHWLWQRYIEAMTMTDIEYWFDRFAVNREQQRKAEGLI